MQPWFGFDRIAEEEEERKGLFSFCSLFPVSFFSQGRRQAFFSGTVNGLFSQTIIILGRMTKTRTIGDLDLLIKQFKIVVGMK